MINIDTQTDVLGHFATAFLFACPEHQAVMDQFLGFARERMKQYFTDLYARQFIGSMIVTFPNGLALPLLKDPQFADGSMQPSPYVPVFSGNNMPGHPGGTLQPTASVPVIGRL